MLGRVLLLSQQRTLLATQSRLEAERMDKANPEFPAELQGNDPELRAATEGQVQIFGARRELHNAHRRELEQRVEQLGEQIKGYEAEVESASRQLDLIAQEIEAKMELEKKGLIPLPTLLALQRLQAEISGQRGQYLATIAQTKQQIGETQLQLQSLDSERADQIATELSKTRVELANVSDRMLASKDVLARTVITAPVSGTVVNMRFKTEGGVVQRGQPILDIVPSDDVLLINARVLPTDIDVVHIGLKALVHFLAFASRNMPRIEGVVRYVSADRLVDQPTGQPYYLARVEVDHDELARLGPQIKLVPGMPAEVLIVTGERTMFQYLFKPFLDAFRRSFRES
jgi:HlyD family secretion protein